MYDMYGLAELPRLPYIDIPDWKGYPTFPYTCKRSYFPRPPCTHRPAGLPTGWRSFPASPI